MNPLAALLRTSPPWILDGGVGTALGAQGTAPGMPPEQWLLSSPERVVAVHRSHLEAGAQAVLSCTFNVHPATLQAAGLQSFCSELRRLAVQAAREAGAQVVGGVIGPIHPHTPPGTVALMAEAAATDLARAGVDLLVVETITDAQEGVARIRGAGTQGLPMVASVVPQSPVCQDIPGFVRHATSAGALVLGVNCAAPKACAPVLLEMAQITGGGLWAKPSTGTSAAGMSPEVFARETAELIPCGVSAIGGCCGAGAEHVRALRRVAHGQG